VVSRTTRGGILQTFVVSPHFSNNNWPELTMLREIGHHRLWRLLPVSKWKPLSFSDPIDELAILRALWRFALPVNRQ
jgi:hypothetical protein